MINRVSLALDPRLVKRSILIVKANLIRLRTDRRKERRSVFFTLKTTHVGIRRLTLGAPRDQRETEKNRDNGQMSYLYSKLQRIFDKV